MINIRARVERAPLPDVAEALLSTSDSANGSRRRCHAGNSPNTIVVTDDTTTTNNNTPGTSMVATATGDLVEALATVNSSSGGGSFGPSHTHAVTIDTDGQLDPDEIPRLLDAARAAPQALILGTRDETAADYPARSRTGRRVSNLLVRLVARER